MREILFRAKHKDLMEWVYGWFTLDAIDEPRIIQKDYSGKGLTFYHVNSNTGGEYTGMCDCNGTKVFEGDIVRYSWGTGDTVNTIRFEDGAFFIGNAVIANLSPSEIEVIGNIHDTPELL